jgi:hypothetical protein
LFAAQEPSVFSSLYKGAADVTIVSGTGIAYLFITILHPAAAAARYFFEIQPSVGFLSAPRIS